MSSFIRVVIEEIDEGEAAEGEDNNDKEFEERGVIGRGRGQGVVDDTEEVTASRNLINNSEGWPKRNVILCV